MSVFNYHEPGEETDLDSSNEQHHSDDGKHLLSLIDNSDENRENYRMTVPVEIVRELGLNGGDPLVAEQKSPDEIIVKVV